MKITANRIKMAYNAFRTYKKDFGFVQGLNAAKWFFYPGFKFKGE